VTELKSLQNIPMNLAKVLKKNISKTTKKYNSVCGVMTLEEQVVELSEKVKEQEKDLRTKEKKLNKTKNKLKSGVRSGNKSQEKGQT
jgi:hypothetical protein